MVIITKRNESFISLPFSFILNFLIRILNQLQMTVSIKKINYIRKT